MLKLCFICFAKRLYQRFERSGEKRQQIAKYEVFARLELQIALHVLSDF